MPPKKRVGRPCKTTKTKAKPRKRVQKGKGFLKTVKKGVMKANTFARKNKLVSRGLSVASLAAIAAGHPEIAKTLSTSSGVARQLGYGMQRGYGLKLPGQ